MPLSKRIQETADPIVHTMKQIIFKRRQENKVIYDFGQAMLDFNPPQTAQRRIENISHIPNLHKLAHVQGLPALREAIATYRQDVIQEKISKEHILVTAGGNHAFVQTLFGITDPGDDILLLSPHFFNHEMNIQLVGAHPLFCPLNAEENFQPNLEEIQKHWTKKTKALVLVNPGNPHGAIIQDEVLKKLERFIASKNTWLIIDESYTGFVYDDKQKNTTPLSLQHTIRIGSFSKSLSLAGWRVGYLIGNTMLLHQLIKSQDANIIHPTIASQHIALVGLQERESFFQSILPTLKSRRDLLKALLLDMSAFSHVYGDGGVFVFAKLQDKWDDMSLAKKLAEELGIITSPGTAWGAPGHLRFSYGMISEEEIKKACALLNVYLQT